MRQLASDRFHMCMSSPPLRVRFELCHEVARVKCGEARYIGAIASSVEPMAGKAGIRSPGITSAERNEFACRGELIRRGTLCDAAARREGEA